MSLICHPPLLPSTKCAHAQRALQCAVSACFGTGRTFSPLCFTDSGFNSDSTQYPADRSGHKQVCFFKLEPISPDHCTYASPELSFGRQTGSFHLFSLCFFPLDGSSAWLYVLFMCGRAVCVCIRV